MFVNPWWIWHCSGNLDPENDPYSEEFRGIDFNFSFSKKLILYFLILIITTILYFIFFRWAIMLLFKIGYGLSTLIIIGGFIIYLFIIFSALKLLK